MRRLITVFVTLAVVAVAQPASAAETVTIFTHQEGTALAASGLLVNYVVGGDQPPSSRIWVEREFTAGTYKIEAATLGLCAHVNAEARLSVFAFRKTDGAGIHSDPLSGGVGCGPAGTFVQGPLPAGVYMLGVELGEARGSGLGSGATLIKVMSLTLTDL